MLKDLLQNNLKLVICGSAAGTESAKRSLYYAGPGNKFWKTLFQVGLTDVELVPQIYAKLVEHGIGLTDIVKNQSGMDSQIDFRRAGIEDFQLKIANYAPKVVCFNGKKAAQTYLSKTKVEYGLQEEVINGSRLFVAPSTSGAANGFWDITYWHELSSLVTR